MLEGDEVRDCTYEQATAPRQAATAAMQRLHSAPVGQLTEHDFDERGTPLKTSCSLIALTSRGTLSQQASGLGIFRCRPLQACHDTGHDKRIHRREACRFVNIERPLLLCRMLSSGRKIDGHAAWFAPAYVCRQKTGRKDALEHPQFPHAQKDEMHVQSSRRTTQCKSLQDEQRKSDVAWAPCQAVTALARSRLLWRVGAGAASAAAALADLRGDREGRAAAAAPAASSGSSSANPSASCAVRGRAAERRLATAAAAVERDAAARRERGAACSLCPSCSTSLPSAASSCPSSCCSGCSAFAVELVAGLAAAEARRALARGLRAERDGRGCPSCPAPSSLGSPCSSSPDPARSSAGRAGSPGNQGMRREVVRW